MAIRSDSEIKRNVEAELRCCPDVDETDIAVKVTGGAVTLTGFVRNFFHKYTDTTRRSRTPLRPTRRL